MTKNIFLLLMIFTNIIFYGQVNDSDFKKQNQDNKNISEEEYNELQSFKNFKNKLDINSDEKYLEKIRTYSKDSLKTLAIKLISIKELDKEKLLRKDISLNTNYYINLLEELKSSEIDKTEYYFLEKELAFHFIKKAEKKYFVSKIINYTLGIIILCFVFYFFKSKNAKIRIDQLSKQEIIIKELIIEGKANKEIADELFISLSTVKTHISNIYTKLNISSRNELIAKFYK